MEENKNNNLIKKINNNIIIGKIEVKKEKSKERITNSFGNIKREYPNWNCDEIKSNEEQIKIC